MELTEFLTARIAEDEAVATLTGDDAEIWEAPFDRPLQWHVTARGAPDMLVVDPARVLAECDAKRRIVALHEPYDADSNLCAGCDGKWDVNDCPNLAALAIVYADHSDYQQEWTP